MLARIAFASIAFVASVPVHAASKDSVVAGWHVSVEKDPFGTDDRVIAAKETGADAIAFRCFSKRPQVAIVNANVFRKGEFVPGKRYDVKLRVDEKPIVTGLGVGVSANLLQIETLATEVYSQAAAGKELAIRVEDGTAYANFRLPLSGARKGLVEFYKACSITPE